MSTSADSGAGALSPSAANKAEACREQLRIVRRALAELPANAADGERDKLARSVAELEQDVEYLKRRPALGAALKPEPATHWTTRLSSHAGAAPGPPRDTGGSCLKNPSCTRGARHSGRCSNPKSNEPTAVAVDEEASGVYHLTVIVSPAQFWV